MRALNTVFNKKSITVFNNIVFNAATIGGMSDIHQTVQRLYEAAKALRSVAGQSAVARLLEVTPQVVRNWELRGLSDQGALLAQKKIGCNANWLLEDVNELRNATWTPSPGTKANPANEPNHSNNSWPFARVTAEQFAKLTPPQRKHIEDGILMLLDSKDSAPNQDSPQRHGAAA